ncbi:MAG: hypothetical protein V7L25_14505 [Nostoc sp.]
MAPQKVDKGVSCKDSMMVLSSPRRSLGGSFQTYSFNIEAPTNLAITKTKSVHQLITARMAKNLVNKITYVLTVKLTGRK